MKLSSQAVIHVTFQSTLTILNVHIVRDRIMKPVFDKRDLNKKYFEEESNKLFVIIQDQTIYYSDDDEQVKERSRFIQSLSMKK